MILDHRTLKLADYVIVLQFAAMGAEAAANFERDCVQTSFGAGELNSVANAKWSARQVIVLSQFGLASLCEGRQGFRRIRLAKSAR